MQACTPNLLESGYLSSRIALCSRLGKPSQNAENEFCRTGFLAERRRGRAAQFASLAASSLERTRGPLAQTFLSSTSLFCERKPAFGQWRGRRVLRKGVCRSSLADLQPVYELANGDTISPWSLVILGEVCTYDAPILVRIWNLRWDLHRQFKKKVNL
jgi:hypothetical protein